MYLVYGGPRCEVNQKISIHTDMKIEMVVWEQREEKKKRILSIKGHL